MKLCTVFLLLLLGLHAHGKPVIEVLRSDTIKSPEGPVCFARGKNGKFALISGRFAKGGKLKSPVSISFLDAKSPKKSFQIRYDPKGYPTEIRFANGARINLKKLEDGPEERDEKSAMSVPKFTSPFRLNWEKIIGISRNELTNNALFGPLIGKDLAELLDNSFDNANKIIERVYDIGAARGNLPKQAMVVMEGWKKDGWELMLEETVPKDAEMIKKTGDLYDAFKTIKDFFEDPSLKDVPGLSNALEDVSEEFREKDALGYWLGKISSQGKVSVKEVITDYERALQVSEISSRISSLIPTEPPVIIKYTGIDYSVRVTATAFTPYVRRIDTAIDEMYELIEVLNDFQDKKSGLYAQAYAIYENQKRQLLTKVSEDLVMLEIYQFSFEDDLGRFGLARTQVLSNPSAFDPEYLPYLNNAIEDREVALTVLGNAIPDVSSLLMSVEAIP